MAKRKKDIEPKKKSVTKKRVSKAKKPRTPRVKETIEKKPVKPISNGYTFNIKDFVVVNEEFKSDLEQYKLFQKQLENGELKFEFWSMGESYYKKQ